MSKPTTTKGPIFLESDSDYTHEEVPLLERNKSDGYGSTVRRLRKKPPTSLGHVRSATIDFSKNFAREIDYTIKKEQLRLARYVTLGTPYPIIHKTVKAVAPKAGPKDADTDWDIVNTDELAVSKDEIHGGKIVDKEPDDDYVIVPTGRKRNKTRSAGSKLEVCAKLATLSAPRVEKVTVNASNALGVGKTPTQQLEEMLDRSAFLGKKVAGK